MASRLDSKLSAVLDLLPVDGSSTPFETFRDKVASELGNDHLPLIQTARRNGMAVFSFDGNGVHVVAKQIAKGGNG